MALPSLDLDFDNYSTPRRRKQAVPSEADPSLLKQIGSKAVGGLAAVGNLLDIPGSMARDLLAAENPLDQLLSPFGSDNRTTGRDLLRKHGLVGPTDTWGNWGGGLAAEIALDPLTYLTFGGAALGKAGKVAKAAGVTGDLTRVAARAAGKTVGAIGPREARVATTLRQLAKHGEPGTARKLAEQARKAGHKLSDIADEPLGGVMGVGLPFSEPAAILGTGARGQSIARGLDTAGKAIKYAKVPFTEFAPVNTAHRLFDSTIKDMVSPVMQSAGRTLFNRQESGRAAARGFVAEYANKLDALGKGEDAKFLREAFEEQDPARVKAYADKEMQKATDKLTAYQQKLAKSNDPLRQAMAGTVMQAIGNRAIRAQIPRPIRDALDEADRFGEMATRSATSAADKAAKMGLPAGTTRPLYSTLAPEMKKVVDDVHKKLETTLKAAEEYGIDAREYIDPEAWYFPRKITESLRQPGGLRAIALSTLNDSRKGRLEFFHGVRGGTNKIVEIASDADLEQLIAGGGSTKDIADFLKAKYANDIPDLFFERGSQKPKDTFKAMAKWFGGISSETRQSGVFGNNPVNDLLHHLEGVSDSMAAARTGVETLAKDIPLQAASGAASVPGTTTLKSLLLNNQTGLGYKPSVFKKLAELKGLPTDSKSLKALANARISEKHADEFKRLVQGYKTPEPAGEVISAIDSLTNLTKTHLTSVWPAFHVRNLTSGLFNNWIAGNFSLKSIRDAHGLLTGGVIQGAADIPILKQLAQQRGMAIDDAVATKLFQELAFSHKILGKFESAAAASGNVQRAVGGGIDDILHEFPGRVPLTAGGIAKKAAGQAPGASWNPLNVRGVGQKTESAFPIAAAGQDIGHYVEGINRLSPFLDQLRRGVDPAEAARNVGAAQVIYASRYYTKTEQEVLSRAAPFYKFTSRQLPFTLRQLFERPGGKLAQTVRGVNRAHGETASTPDYVADTASIPLGEKPDGTQRYLTGLGLPFESSLGLLTPNIKDAGLEALSQLNPLAKGPLELFTGKSFFQRGPEGGRDLGDLDPALGRILANAGQMTGLRDSKEPVRFPGSGIVESLLSNSPASRAITTARTLTDQRPGALGKAALNLGTGVKITDVSPATQDRTLQQRAQLLEKDLGAKTFSRTYIPDEVEADMSPEEKAMMQRLDLLRKMLEERRKRR